MDVADSTTTSVAGTPPTTTAAPGTKWSPAIRTAVPPVEDPCVGSIEKTDGAVAPGCVGPPHRTIKSAAATAPRHVAAWRNGYRLLNVSGQ